MTSATLPIPGRSIRNLRSTGLVGRGNALHASSRLEVCMLRLLLPVLIAATATSGCGVSVDWDGPAVAGSGVRTSVTRTVSACDLVDVGGAYDVVVRVGAAPSVVLEGDDNLLPL